MLLIVVFAWISWEDQNFLTPEGFLAYLKTSAPLAILAIGAYFVLASGEFDLSVGSLVTVVVGRRGEADRRRSRRTRCR